MIETIAAFSTFYLIIGTILSMIGLPGWEEHSADHYLFLMLIWPISVPIYIVRSDPFGKICWLVKFLANRDPVGWISKHWRIFTYPVMAPIYFVRSRPLEKIAAAIRFLLTRDPIGWFAKNWRMFSQGNVAVDLPRAKCKKYPTHGGEK